MADKTIIEVKQLTVAKPTASAMALPAVCSSAPPPPPTEAQRLAALTGGDGADFANAITPPRAPQAIRVPFCSA